MGMRSIALVSIFKILIFSVSVQAFPEMIRLGYVNCTSCHVSPTGGGLMTDYGRSISAEVLSSWAKPQEELLGHGFLAEAPPWLKLGGDVRLIQTYVDTPQSTASSFFPMQMDIEVGLNLQKFWWVQSLGWQGGPARTPNRGELVSRHFYGLYNYTDEIFIRAGKYRMPHGLNIPDHTSFVRRNLGFDQGHESYNVDMGYIGEKWSAGLALNFGRKDSNNIDLEKGGSLQIGYILGDAQKISGSFSYLEKDNGSSRFVFGPQILWGFNEKWVFLGEIDYQEKKIESSGSGIPKGIQKGAVTYARLQYEWLRGFHSYLLHQWSYLDFTRLETRVNRYGSGILFYPRPHFEITAELAYQETAVTHSYSTVAWVVGHYYF